MHQLEVLIKQARAGIRFQFRLGLGLGLTAYPLERQLLIKQLLRQASCRNGSSFDQVMLAIWLQLLLVLMSTQRGYCFIKVWKIKEYSCKTIHICRCLSLFFIIWFDVFGRQSINILGGVGYKGSCLGCSKSLKMHRTSGHHVEQRLYHLVHHGIFSSKTKSFHFTNCTNF